MAEDLPERMDVHLRLRVSTGRHQVNVASSVAPRVTGFVLQEGTWLGG